MVALLSGCGGGGAPRTQPKPAPAAPAAAQIEGGVLHLALGLAPSRAAARRRPRSLLVDISGPFRGASGSRLPDFALAIDARSAGRRLRAAMTAVGGWLFLQLGPRRIRLSGSVVGELRRAYASAAGGSAAAGRAPSRPPTLLGAVLARRRATVGRATVDGEQTVHLRAVPEGAALLGYLRTAASLAEALGASPDAPWSAALAGRLTSARSDVYLRTGGRLRRLVVAGRLAAQPPAVRGGGEGWTLSLLLDLAPSAHPPAIAAPGSAAASSGTR